LCAIAIFRLVTVASIFAPYLSSAHLVERALTHQFSLVFYYDTEPGQMLAVMGPSGSGKTSLLNVLSAKLFGLYEGDVSINGQIADRTIIRRVAGFVPQEDILYGSQTVREALQFYADLKLPTTLSSQQKSEMIDYMLLELGLKKVEHSLIGYVGADAATSGLPRGLSGGERKRLSIGCQLISNPSLLFLDEPTTGLDSYASESVINTLSKLALQGRTIVFTIHQPSVEVLSLFDRLLLLGRGRTVYSGTNAEMLDYFASIGYKCPPWENPANYLMDTIHGDSQSYEEKLDAATKTKEKDAQGSGTAPTTGGALESKYDHAEEQAIKLADFFEESPLRETKVKKSPPPINTAANQHRAGFGRALSCVMARQFKHLLREPGALRAGLGQVVFIALVMGLIYLRLGHTNTNLSDRTGALFFAVVFTSFGGILGPFFGFATERKLFLFQQQDGLYSTSVFYVGKIAAEMPMFVLTSTVWSVIFYWMCNFRPGAGHFFIYWIVTILVVNVAYAYGMFIVNLIPNQQVALQVFPVLFMPLMIFSGFYLNKDNTPPYFIWVQYISFIKWAFQAIMLNEFTDVAFHCKGTEFRDVNGFQYCPFTNGTQWLEYNRMRDFPIYGDIIIVIELTILFHIVAFVMLRRTAHSNSG
jgi:ABC-type multidrug transport system ATPase subunit/ABC-type multidrug transport system permease subunit